MKTSTTATRLREVMEEKDLRAVDLLKLCEPLCEKYNVKLSKNYLSQYLSGKFEPNQSRVMILATALGVSEAWLMGFDVPKTRSDDFIPIETMRIPVLGEIACGEPIMADEHLECYVNVGTKVHADFALRAKGDSMVNARILDGDLVFIHKQDMVDNGEIAAVIIEDEATLKRVYYDKEGQKLTLVAENPKYAPFVYVGSELENIHILGKAVAFQSDVR